MWACLFADPALVSVRPEVLRGLVGRMIPISEKFRKEHKIWPHPAQVYHMAVAGERAEQAKKKAVDVRIRQKRNW